MRSPQDRLGTGKIIAALLLLSGVVLVCKPPFLFHSLSHKERMTVSTRSQKYSLEPYHHQDEQYGLYYVGLILALVSCFCGGVMNVVVSK